ncbi:MAG: hypothetical protein ACK5MY_18955 [Jhaorihella sp.]
MKLILACLAITFALVTPARAQVEIGFGPNPRSHDNLEMWNYASGWHRDRWNALRSAGVTRIDLNSTFLLRHFIERETQSAWEVRPTRTYLTAPQFAQMKDMVNIGGFQFSYIGGLGLAANRCHDIAADPVAGGQTAASVEFNNVLLPMLNNNVKVHELNVDGPFLRLIDGSQKGFSCSKIPVSLDTNQTVAAVDAYLKKMVALLGAHPIQAGITPDVVLTINLPNWKVGARARVFDPGPGDIDLITVLDAFDAYRDGHGHNPKIHKLKIDYPYCYVQSVSPCTSGGATLQRDIFADKIIGLWDHTREINGAGLVAPNLSVAVNTHKAADSCVETDTLYPHFLVYRACTPPPSDPGSGICPASSAWIEPEWSCYSDSIQIVDPDFFQKSADFADELQPGGALTGLIDTRSASAGITIDRLIFHAWGEVPWSNQWYRDRVTQYAD